MNSFLLLILRSFFLFLFSFGFLEALDFTKKEKDWIAKHPTVTLGSDYSWAPYDFADKEGKHLGISADFLALISEKSGLKFDIKLGVWSNILSQMKEGKLDGLSCAVLTEKRKKYLHFSTPYMSMPLAIVVQDSRDDIKTITDLKGQLVAVNKESYLHEWLVEKHPEIKLKLTTSNNTALEEVSFSKVDAYVGNIAVATYIMKTHYLSNVKIVGRVDYMSTNVSIAIAKENKVLQSIIAKTLQSISSTEKKKIQDKWIAFEFSERIDYTLVYQILGLFLFFILGTLYWYRKLNYEVQKRKESESQMTMLIDNIPLNVIVSGFDGSVLRANTFALQTFNILAEDIYTYNVLEFYVDSSERDAMIETIKTEGKVSNSIVKFKRLDDSEMNIMISIIPIMYDGSKALLSIMVDLTERVAMEEDLRQAKGIADSANKSKSEFLANMSHEIRTPMNAIIGFTELLNEQVKEPRLKGYIKTIKSAGYSLLTLINDILDLSKIEAGKMEINKTSANLFDLADDIGNIFTMSVKSKGLELIIEVDEEIPKSLLLDEIRLRQILVNLIGNAIKFTDEGYVKLKMYAVNVNDHQSKLDLQIEVEDSGIGISPDQLEHVFKAFEQQEGQDNRKFGGTGLGLSISKRLVDMMGGDISLGSIKGEGTTFFVHFYNVDISAVEAASKKNDSLIFNAQTIVFKPATVLVVDDIEDNRELIVNNFKNTALTMITASDGYEAIAQYEKEKPDLIIMDIRMPNMDGYEAASKIRQMGDTPIVALTASVMKDEHDRIKSEDFDGYLRKPVLRNELFLEFSRYLAYDKVELSQEDEKRAYTFELNDNMIHHLDAIYDMLHNEIKPLHVQAMKRNNIEDIKLFTQKVNGLASRYDIGSLKEYASLLAEATDAFDIAKMQSLLRDYSSLKLQLESIVI